MADQADNGVDHININNVGTLGVQIAFVVSTTITIIAVILAYLINALDDEQLNFLDRYVIGWVQTKGRALKKWLMRNENHLTRRESCVTQEDLSQLLEFRREAISRFILAVSDTQLVTGLAVLIAGIYGVCNGSVSVYELHVIISQAWLSATTHLATLDALRNHLRSYGIVRDIRVACMVLLLLLLTIAFGFLQTNSDTYSPAKAFSGLHSPSSPWTNPTGTIGTVAWIAVLLLIWSNCIVRIQDLYTKQRHPMYLVTAIAWRLGRHGKSGLSHREHFAEFMVALQKRRMRRIQRSKGLSQKFFEAVYAYDNSFISLMPGVFFCFAYGVTWNINIYVVIPLAHNLDLKHGDLGFGQLMPLLLLLLPLFAVGATYYEYRNKLERALTRSSVPSTELPIALQTLQNQLLSRAQQTPHEQSLEEFEDSIGLTPTVCFFSIKILLMTSLAVLLNVGWYQTSSRMMKAACIFLFFFGIEILWIVYEILEWLTTRVTGPEFDEGVIVPKVEDEEAEAKVEEAHIKNEP